VQVHALVIPCNQGHASHVTPFLVARDSVPEGFLGDRPPILAKCRQSDFLFCYFLFWLYSVNAASWEGKYKSKPLKYQKETGIAVVRFFGLKNYPLMLRLVCLF
jgi:hypothetical protein